MGPYNISQTMKLTALGQTLARLFNESSQPRPRYPVVPSPPAHCSVPLSFRFSPILPFTESGRLGYPLLSTFHSRSGFLNRRLLAGPFNVRASANSRSSALPFFFFFVDPHLVLRSPALRLEIWFPAAWNASRTDPDTVPIGPC